MERREPHDGGHARGELLRGIGFDSYDALRAVAACDELLQGAAGGFDLAGVVCCGAGEVQMESTRHQRCGI